MPQLQNAFSSQQEGRIELALTTYRSGQIASLRRAATTFGVPRTTLLNRNRGITFLPNRRNGRHKITLTEEQTIVRYILDLDSRGFAPRLDEVADMANKLLAARGGELVGKNWAERL